MRINNIVRTALLSGTIQLLTFQSGLQVIICMCNDPEMGVVCAWKTGMIDLPNKSDPGFVTGLDWDLCKRLTSYSKVLWSCFRVEKVNLL